MILSGETIKALRDRLDETQVEFARRFDIDQGTVSRWESGEQRHPTSGLSGMAFAHVIRQIRAELRQKEK